jgi:hypothetical protein
MQTSCYVASRESLAEDISVIRKVRLEVPSVRLLLVGMTEGKTEFFQYVRSGNKWLSSARRVRGRRPGGDEGSASG